MSASALWAKTFWRTLALRRDLDRLGFDDVIGRLRASRPAHSLSEREARFCFLWARRWARWSFDRSPCLLTSIVIISLDRSMVRLLIGAAEGDELHAWAVDGSGRAWSTTRELPRRVLWEFQI